MNIAVLIGTLSSAPQVRTLPSGDQLTVLQLTTEAPDPPGAPDGGRRTSVAISLPGAASATRWQPGDRLAVVGHVLRRFYRAGATTASVTEVRARRVVACRSAGAVRRALAEAAAAITAGG